MKIITCASYYGSGSSALTDLVSEYDNVKDMSNFEFRFLHDLDGVRDLEYQLVENHNRHNSGHALKRFKRLSEFNEGNVLSRRYSQFFEGDEYHTITNEYINSLIDFSYPGWWFYDLYDKGSKNYYAYQILNHLFRKVAKGRLRILPNEVTYCTHPTETQFVEHTKTYVSHLMRALNKEEKEYLEIDQILPSSNLDSFFRYFEDELFVFIVDRDPRDIYLLGKYHWQDGICPSDPELFCKWYEYVRRSGAGKPDNNSHVLILQFEDLIYRYNETVSCVEQMTGLTPDKHNRQFKKLNPRRSVVNTRLWLKYAEDEGVRIIESRLPEFLYDYSEIDVDNICGVEVDNKTNF